MSDSRWEHLAEFLKDGGIAERDTEVIDEWRVESEVTPKCPRCGSGLKSSGSGYVCKAERHVVESQEVSSVTSSLDVDAVLSAVCDAVGLDVASDIERGELPAAAAVNTSSGARITLVCNERNQKKTLDRVFGDSVRKHRVNVVFTPSDLKGDVWEQVSKYPVGGLAPPFPLTLLDTPDVVSDIVEQAVISRDRSQMALDMQEMDSGLYELLNRNPRLIEAELSYTRILRENGNGGRVGDRLEDVTKAAFMTMDMPLQPYFGGKSGENVTDIAAKVPSAESFSPSTPVLALVDTKSGSDPNLSDEQIVQKHREYLRQANPESFEGWHIAHMFVVYQMAGKSANELDWYDAIQDAMQSSSHYSGDTTMVVLFAGALAHLVDAHLSVAQRNQLNLSISNLRDSLHALFNWREFRNRVPKPIQRMTRVHAADGELTKADEEYIEGYHQREQLLVITPEMVDSYLREIMTDDEYAVVETDLSKYPSKW
jgi:hypothetical protein